VPSADGYALLGLPTGPPAVASIRQMLLTRATTAA
jgi:hypothetical protein